MNKLLDIKHMSKSYVIDIEDPICSSHISENDQKYLQIKFKAKGCERGDVVEFRISHNQALMLCSYIEMSEFLRSRCAPERLINIHNLYDII